MFGWCLLFKPRGSSRSLEFSRAVKRKQVNDFNKMKHIITISFSVMLLAACANGITYPTRAELKNDPESKTELVFKMPVKEAYPLLRDMTRDCLETLYVKSTAEAPGIDGRGGNVSITRFAGTQARVLSTTELEPTENGGTRITIYNSGDNPPEALVLKYKRWIEVGAKSCTD